MMRHQFKKEASWECERYNTGKIPDPCQHCFECSIFERVIKANQCIAKIVYDYESEKEVNSALK